MFGQSGLNVVGFDVVTVVGVVVVIAVVGSNVVVTVVGSSVVVTAVGSGVVVLGAQSFIFGDLGPPKSF